MRRAAPAAFRLVSKPSGRVVLRVVRGLQRQSTSASWPGARAAADPSARSANMGLKLGGNLRRQLGDRGGGHRPVEAGAGHRGCRCRLAPSELRWARQALPGAAGRNRLDQRQGGSGLEARQQFRRTQGRPLGGLDARVDRNR